MKHTPTFFAALLFSSFAGLHAADASKFVPPGWDPKAAADKVLASLIKVTAPEVKGAHGAKLTLVGDRAYVAALANNVQPGERHEWDFIYSTLSVVNL